MYASYLGGSGQGDDFVVDLAVDATGAAYLVGLTMSADFPVTPGAFQTPFHGFARFGRVEGQDGFAAKLDPNGSRFAWVTFLGGRAEDSARGVVLDGAGRPIITGCTRSADFPTANALQPALADDVADAFVTKLRADGSGLVFSTFLGGTQSDAGRSVALDRSDNIVVAGSTAGPDFLIAGPLDSPFGGGLCTGGDGFVVTLTPAADAIVSGGFVGGPADEDVEGLAVDRLGDVVVTGAAGGGFPTTPGVLRPTAGDSMDGFVAKLSAGGVPAPTTNERSSDRSRPRDSHRGARLARAESRARGIRPRAGSALAAARRPSVTTAAHPRGDAAHAARRQPRAAARATRPRAPGKARSHPRQPPRQHALPGPHEPLRSIRRNGNAMTILEVLEDPNLLERRQRRADQGETTVAGLAAAL